MPVLRGVLRGGVYFAARISTSSWISFSPLFTGFEKKPIIPKAVDKSVIFLL